MTSLIEPILLDVEMPAEDIGLEIDFGDEIEAELDNDDEIDVELDTAIIVYEDEAEPYSGNYSITPDFETQVLQTQGKRMRNDVTVVPIPVSRTTNLSGGTTVYIGGVFDNAL